MGTNMDKSQVYIAEGSGIPTITFISKNEPEGQRKPRLYGAEGKWGSWNNCLDGRSLDNNLNNQIEK